MLAGAMASWHTATCMPDVRGAEGQQNRVMQSIPTLASVCAGGFHRPGQIRGLEPSWLADKAGTHCVRAFAKAAH